MAVFDELRLLVMPGEGLHVMHSIYSTRMPWHRKVLGRVRVFFFYSILLQRYLNSALKRNNEFAER